MSVTRLNIVLAWPGRFVTFPGYEMGIQNATITLPVGSPEVVRHDVKHVRIYRNWRNLGLRWCWIIWQNGSKISIIVIQLTKSKFPTTASSEKMSPNDCDNDGQPEIATWPLKPEIAIATWATFSELVMIENPRFAVGISTVSITDVRRPYCYFRLTVVVEIIHEHCL